MKKENKGRLIFWGFIWIIVLALTGYGYYGYLQGYGVKGDVRKTLKPIVKNFNSLQGLKAYKDIGIQIDANIKDTTIVVTYKTSTASATFTFDYQTIASEKVLYMKYSSADEATANLIIKSMIESVSMVNGHTEGEVFSANKYKLEDFYSTTILEGVQIKSETTSNEVYININKSIIEGIEERDKTTITDTDLNTLKTEITTNKEFLIEKEKISLYVQDTTVAYLIYISASSEEANSYSTVSKVIKELSGEETEQKFINNIQNLKADTTFENITVQTNPDLTNTSKFTGKTNVTLVTITKVPTTK